MLDYILFLYRMDEKLTRKEILVVDGQKTKSPSSITHSIFVSSDSFWLVFTISDLNYLDMYVCGIGNTYLNSNCREKLCTKVGVKFFS